MKDLNSPYRGIEPILDFLGGLSSYGVVLLLLAFLNSDPMQLLAEDNGYSWARVPPSRIFSSFLHYYGRLFDTSVTFINAYCLLTPKP